MTTRACLPALCAIALAATSCTPRDEGPGTPGELGNGTFDYTCALPSDAICDDGLDKHPMPKFVALDATFSASYTPIDGGDPVRVEPASPEFFDATDTVNSGFKAIREGFAAILATRGETIVDIVHVRIAAPDHLRVDEVLVNGEALKQGVTSVEVPAGDGVQIRAVPLNADDDLMGGGLACAWASSDATIADVGANASDNLVRVEGKAMGQAVMSVQLGKLSADVTVDVLEGAGGAGGMGGGGGAGGSGGAGGAGGGA